MSEVIEKMTNTLVDTLNIRNIVWSAWELDFIRKLKTKIEGEYKPHYSPAQIKIIKELYETI